MTTKQSILPFPQTLSECYERYEGGPWTPYGHGPYGVREVMEQRGVDCNCKLSILRDGGWLPVNGYTVWTQKTTRLPSAPNTYVVRRKSNDSVLYERNGGRAVYGDTFDAPALVHNQDGIPPYDSALWGRLLNAAAADAASAAVDIAVTLAELPETVAMLRNGLEAAVDWFAEFNKKVKKRWKAEQKLRSNPRISSAYQRGLERRKKERGDSGRRIASDYVRYGNLLSSMWLTYRYGLLPTILEIEGYMKAIKSTNVSARQRGFKEQSTSWETSDDVLIASNANAELRRLSTGRIKDRYIAYCWYESQLRTRFDYNLISGVYEGTTLSFVLDWFVDIGSWLKVGTAFASGDFFGSAVGVRTSSTNLFQYYWNVHDTPTTYVEGDPGNLATYTNEERYIRAPLAPGYEQVGFSFRLTSNRAADAIALMFQAMKSKLFAITRSP